LHRISHTYVFRRANKYLSQARADRLTIRAPKHAAAPDEEVADQLRPVVAELEADLRSIASA